MSRIEPVSAPKLTEAERFLSDYQKALAKLSARIDKTFAHTDGTPHSVSGPSGCVACAARRRAPAPPRRRAADRGKS